MVPLAIALGALAMCAVVWATHHMYVMMFEEITIDGTTYKFKDLREAELREDE